MTEPLQDAAVIASIVSFPVLSFPSYPFLGFVLVLFWFVLFWFAYFVWDWFELFFFFGFWFELFGSFPLRYVPLCLLVALLSCFGFASPCLLCLPACVLVVCLLFEYVSQVLEVIMNFERSFPYLLAGHFIYLCLPRRTCYGNLCVSELQNRSGSSVVGIWPTWPGL